MRNEFTADDFHVGDNVQAFHPHMLGVILYGQVVKVGRVWLYVDFGEIRGGVFRVSPTRDVTENWGQG